MSHKGYLLVIGLVSFCIFIPHLSVVEINIMEARNFITAREMLDYNHWIHTTMNLEPRYEKPPLPTWLTALSAAVFGDTNLVGLRLPAVVSVIFLLFTFYQLATEILRKHKQAFIATLILSTSFYIIFSGRNGQWDIFAHAFMVFAILQLFRVFNTTEKSWSAWILAGIFLGLSFMSKGPVSLFALLLPFLIAYGWIYKFKGLGQKVPQLVIMLIVFAVVGLTWGLYIYLTDSSSAEFIAEKETKAWANRSVKPFYHYWSFFVQSGVWAFFSLMALIYPYMIKRVKQKKYYLFSLIWTLSAVILLSLIPEKKERYLLPVLIPMALNTSFLLAYLFEKARELSKSDRVLSYFGFGLIGLIALIFPFGAYFFFKGNIDGYWVSYFFSSTAIFSLGLLMFRWIKKKQFERCFYGVILFVCSIMLFAFPMAELTYNNNEYLSLKTLRSTPAMKEIKLYSTDRLLPSPELIFDLGEPIKRVKQSSELPQDEVFALLVNDSIPTEVKNEFRIEFKAQFDINNRKKGERGHKKRKTIKLYTLQKK